MQNVKVVAKKNSKNKKNKTIPSSKITVIGAGYVGLVTAACFAEMGYNVLCVEIDEKKLDMLNRCQSPIHEDGLNDLLKKNIEKKKRLSFTNNIVEGINEADFLFIAVGTPSAKYGSANLKYVFNVATDIGKHLGRDCIIVNKSTSPLGTAIKIKKIISEELKKRHKKLNFHVVSNPEFLKQGDAIKDFLSCDRVVIGADEEDSMKKMIDLYSPLKTKIVTMDTRSAELTKYAANAFLATKISFINEMALLCEKFGASISCIKKGIGSDLRIGPNFLNAGCGYGGSCFPKDVQALIWMARENGMEVPLFEAVENINFRQKCVIFNGLKKFFKNDLKEKVIALWGLSFKPNTDDMREAPSRVLMELLWQEEAIVKAYDPVASRRAKEIYGDRKDLILCKTALDTIVGADALAIITEWDEFVRMDVKILATVKRKLKNPVIFDGRNIFSPKLMKSIGFQYHGIGNTEI